MENKKLSVRWGYLAIGVIAMLFAGVLYAWSILKAPLAKEFGWGASDLALNFGTGNPSPTFLCSGIQHVFNKYSITRCGVIARDMPRMIPPELK